MTTVATATGGSAAARASDPDSPAKTPGCTGARLRRLTRRVTALYEHHLRAAGLTLPQYSLLMNLAAAPQPLTALADRMEMDRTTLTRSLQPLLDHEWVAESRGTDARQRLFALTAEGRRARQEARHHWQTAQLAVERQLGPEFVANLHRQLDQALSRLKPALPESN
jgi:DNA-binding MarR family transcriptional regulator